MTIQDALERAKQLRKTREGGTAARAERAQAAREETGSICHRHGSRCRPSRSRGSITRTRASRVRCRSLPAPQDSLHQRAVGRVGAGRCGLPADAQPGPAPVQGQQLVVHRHHEPGRRRGQDGDHGQSRDQYRAGKAADGLPAGPGHAQPERLRECRRAAAPGLVAVLYGECERPRACCLRPVSRTW